MSSRASLVVAAFVVALWVCPAERFRVVTYNVENLFDTCHDVGFDDLEFLPSSGKKWDSRRYWAKQGRLARVIAAVGGDSPAELVALCEVENDSCVRDLCRRTHLARLGYDYVMTQSWDSRGIDVALLYQPMRFRLLSVRSCRVPLGTGRERRTTRDILHAAGLLVTGDTLDVFVCHFPSRRNGKAAARHRLTVAAELRALADSVMNRRAKPAVLMLGDFNDEYWNASLRNGLGVLPPPGGSAVNPCRYYALSAGLKSGSIRGTYKYKETWNQLDQIIVSGTLLFPESSMSAVPGGCRIFAPSFLSLPDESLGGVKPFRNYLSSLYLGGFSDHFPLVADFRLRR